MTFLDRLRRNRRPSLRFVDHPLQSVTPAGPGHTTDRDDPRLGHGSDAEPIEQHDVYLVLSDEERARGFVRPVRRSYVHVGPPGPEHPLRDLTAEEAAQHDGASYAKYEEYPPSKAPVTGRFWTQARLDDIGHGCGSVTTMSLPIAETSAREPRFYGSTYCCTCARHLPVGVDGEFVWDDGTGQRVGT